MEVSVLIQLWRQSCSTAGPERGHLEFLRNDYQKVYDQYFAIENLEARLAFFEERKQIVQRINEVNVFFLSKLVSNHWCICSMLGFVSPGQVHKRLHVLMSLSA